MSGERTPRKRLFRIHTGSGIGLARNTSAVSNTIVTFRLLFVRYAAMLEIYQLRIIRSE